MATLTTAGCCPRWRVRGCIARFIRQQPPPRSRGLCYWIRRNCGQEDAEFKEEARARTKKSSLSGDTALYYRKCAACLPMFSAVGYGKTFEIGKGIEVTFHDAGHVLGSAMIEVRIRQNKSYGTLLFSGDVGRWGQPISASHFVSTGGLCPCGIYLWRWSFLI